MLGFAKARKVSFYEACFGALAPVAAPANDTGTAGATDFRAQTTTRPRVAWTWDDGEKYPGGFGATQLLTADYWTLRARSTELFERNLYARGLIRRLITNEINTGLHLEALPGEKILGLQENDLADWTEDVENRFEIWGDNPDICDFYGAATFGELQAAARLEALVAGDVLVVMRQDPRTGLPSIQLISGSAVQTPLGAKPQGNNRIAHGVEVDSLGRHVAFWILQDTKDGSGRQEAKRLPAYGEKTGRRLAWLVYGTEKRLDDVRGKPILALVLQALKEIDRYRDAALRKAVINSMLAIFVKKGEDKPGTTPFGRNATKRTVDVAPGDSATPQRNFRVAELMPGAIVDELQHGEEPVGFHNQGVDDRFRDFEEAILATIAWAHGIPPEILTLSFSHNYSASQAATNEFNMYLNEVRTKFGFAFCQPIYIEWLNAQVLKSKIEAKGLFEARRDASQHDVFGAWVQADWTGQIKPAIDQQKRVNAHVTMCENGFSSYDTATRELTGTKFSRNVQKIRREAAALAEAIAPIMALQKGPSPDAGTAEDADAADAAQDAKTKKKSPPEKSAARTAN